jgi:hypothetical protein
LAGQRGKEKEEAEKARTRERIRNGVTREEPGVRGANGKGTGDMSGEEVKGYKKEISMNVGG